MSKSNRPSKAAESVKGEGFLIALVGWIPLSIGRLLRQVVYRAIFGRLGRSVRINPGVEFVCALGIELGHGVKLDRGASLRNHGPRGRIYVGNEVSLDLGVIVKTHVQGDICIGDRTYIGPYTCISGQTISIGEDCLIASHCGIYANNHAFAELDIPIILQGATYKGITIEDDCWLGCGVKVLDGVTIGRGSVVGAGSVVTKNIPPYAIAVGVPAKVVSWRKKSAELPSLQTPI
ncbi:MAG: acyltransferase [Desertifilum sp. SIO1I2]|nr:acyltransferase [Desertifilum sp. SIO1I2]